MTTFRGSLAFVITWLTVLFPVPATAFTINGGSAPFASDTTAPHKWITNTNGASFWHWDLREFKDCRIPWSPAGGTANVPGLDEFDQIEKAFKKWEEVDPALIGFERVNAPGPGLAPGNIDARNMVGWGLVEGLTVALTYTYATASGRILEADIRFSDHPFWTWQVVDHNMSMHSAKPDVWSVAMHEIGHFIGIGHADQNPAKANPPGPIMNPEFIYRTNTDSWAVPANKRVCGANVGPDVVIITGVNGVVVTPPNNCDPGTGDDVYFDGTIESGPNGKVDTDIAKVNDRSNHVLAPDDQDACNFLYTPDLGDAPDPFKKEAADKPPGFYPSKVHVGTGRTLNGKTLSGVGPGAQHILGRKPVNKDRNFTYEWLAQGSPGNVDPECEARVTDEDKPSDDGVTWVPNPPVWGKKLTLKNWIKYASDNAGNEHDYAAHRMGANSWIDFDQDGDFEEGERVIHQLKNPPPLPDGPNKIAAIEAESTFTLPAKLNKPDEPVWLRARLDWGEDVGNVFKLDSTLAQPRGAAQFGEVEDWYLKCPNPTRQQFPKNNGNGGYLGAAMVFPGRALIGTTYAAFVDQSDCVEPQAARGPTDVPSQPTVDYDPLRDETTVYYNTLPFSVAEGNYFHTGRAQPDSTPASVLRSYWIPMNEGPPSETDMIPTTNSVAHARFTGGASLESRVVVGVPNDLVGGVVTGNPSTNLWDDSVAVTVVARIAPNPIPLHQLSLCHPSLQTLTPIPLGGATIHPGRPFESTLMGLRPEHTLILEIRSSWSVNAHTNVELVEFPDPIPELRTTGTGAPPAQGPRLEMTSYPNPIAGLSTIRYTLPAPARVSLGVYDIRGSLVRVLHKNEGRDAGPQVAIWNGRDGLGRSVPPGIYFYVLRAGTDVARNKVVVLQ